MVAGAVWTNMKDPDDSDAVALLPKRPHRIAVERLSQTEKDIEEGFPSLESHKSDSTDAYLFGELAFPVFDPEAENIGTISVRLVVEGANFARAIADDLTSWPVDFDPERAGVAIS